MDLCCINLLLHTWPQPQLRKTATLYRPQLPSLQALNRTCGRSISKAHTLGGAIKQRTRATHGAGACHVSAAERQMRTPLMREAATLLPGGEVWW